MTFRTNQPGSALASLSAFLEQSMQNRAMDLRKIPFWTARIFLFLRWNFSCLPSSFNHSKKRKRKPRRWIRHLPYLWHQKTPVLLRVTLARLARIPFLRCWQTTRRSRNLPTQSISIRSAEDFLNGYFFLSPMRLSDWRKECVVRFRRLYEENLADLYSRLEIFVPIPIRFLLIQLPYLNLLLRQLSLPFSLAPTSIGPAVTLFFPRHGWSIRFIR